MPFELLDKITYIPSTVSISLASYFYLQLSLDIIRLMLVDPNESSTPCAGPRVCTCNSFALSISRRSKRSLLGPVHTYPEICENANFFLRMRLASTRIQCIFRPYPEIFENALQSGNFFIQYEYVYVWTVVSANLRIRLRHFLGSSLHVEHYKQTWLTARLYLLC